MPQTRLIPTHERSLDKRLNKPASYPRQGPCQELDHGNDRASVEEVNRHPLCSRYLAPARVARATICLSFRR